MHLSAGHVKWSAVLECGFAEAGEASHRPVPKRVLLATLAFWTVKELVFGGVAGRAASSLQRALDAAVQQLQLLVQQTSPRVRHALRHSATKILELQ